MPDINANINSAECMVQKTNLGSSTFVNICNGNEIIVPWAFGDWLVASILGVFITALVIAVWAFVYYVVLDN